MQIADIPYKGFRQGKQFVPAKFSVALFRKGAQQHKRLVKRDRANRVL